MSSQNAWKSLAEADATILYKNLEVSIVSAIQENYIQARGCHPGFRKLAISRSTSSTYCTEHASIKNEHQKAKQGDNLVQYLLYIQRRNLI